MSLVGCADLDYPYNSGYNDPYDYNHHNDYDYYRDRNRREQREIDRERDRLEEDRRRLEREREHEYRAPPPVYQPPRREERCPSGFSPSENKCSPEERRRGCKDMRLPGGLGCVSR